MSLTVYEGIESGKEYRFTYYAINLHGSGLASDPLSIKAANKPSRMDAPTVTLQAGLLYEISFASPNPGGVGIVIEAYEIVFRRKDG